MGKIVLYPAEILKKRTETIKAVSLQLLKEISRVEKMLMKSGDTAAGLAATQAGINRRFFEMKTNGKKDIEIFINPRIVKTFGKKVYPMVAWKDGREEHFLEGCLSFPNLFGEVKRYLKIEAEWEVVGAGKLVTKKKLLEAFEAIVFQHEAEHLDGILFVDHIKEEGGKLYRWVGEKKIEIGVDKIIDEKSW